MPFLQFSRDIFIWRIDLDVSRDLTTFYDLLDADERARADRFRFPEHRRRFIVAHAAVRSILGSVLGIAPENLRFAKGDHGKPFLANSGAPIFSLSHSHELALCAVAGAGELGVDVEWCRDLAHGELAQRFFSTAEALALEQLPAESQREGFFACWTSKEAYIKAKGLGLSLPLDSFVVATDPNRPPALLSSQHEPSDAEAYRLWNIPVANGYRAVIAYRGEDVGRPCYIDWASPF